MKKFTRPLLILPLLLGALLGQRLTLEDIFLNRTYSGESFNISAWVEEGAAFLTTRRTDPSGRRTPEGSPSGTGSLQLDHFLHRIYNSPR